MVVALAGTFHPVDEASTTAAKQKRKVCTQEAYPRVAYVHLPGLGRCDRIPALSSVTGHSTVVQRPVSRIDL